LRGSRVRTGAPGETQPRPGVRWRVCPPPVCRVGVWVRVQNGRTGRGLGCSQISTKNTALSTGTKPHFEVRNTSLPLPCRSSKPYHTCHQDCTGRDEKPARATPPPHRTRGPSAVATGGMRGRAQSPRSPAGAPRRYTPHSHRHHRSR
jgi:hypothetical protein